MNDNKRKRDYSDDPTLSNNNPTRSSIYYMLYNYFNETTKDEEIYINEVSNYFNMLNDTPDTCANLPDVKKNNYTFEELSEGQQIYITGEKEIIYIIKEKNDENKTIKIQQNNINRIDESNIISADKVENIININPDSLHIDPTYLAKINITDPKYFGNTKDGLILKIKYYKTKITICRIKLKKYASVPGDNVVAEKNENDNLTEYKRLLNETIQELASISDEQSITIDDIKKNFRGLYGIGNMSNALDIFNNNIFTTFFNLGVNKDVIIRKYIILMDCLSVIGIAGIVESTNLLLNGTDPRSGWVYFCINAFITNISIIITPSMKTVFINNALLPCISYYLCTNMDTLYLITDKSVNSFTSSLTTFFNYILCGLNNASEDQNNDDETMITENTSVVSEVSEKTVNSLNSNITASTFPSLSSIESLYNSQDVTDDHDDDNVKTYGKALTHDLEIITQNNSVLELSQTSTIPSQSSQGSLGGKIKRSRVTKKHKRMTIRGSKKSKKMKGGKRTQSTKKRRVVRRKKHNTKRR